MKKKIAKERAAALGNMRKIREKTSRYMRQNSYFLFLQWIIMHRSIKEEQNIDLWSAKKEDTIATEFKFNALFEKIKKKYSKINVKKVYLNTVSKMLHF